ncbi:hypothetical protein BsWGS_06057 [Bradybaena similaris]
MVRGYCMVILACVLSSVWSQDFTTLLPGETECQEHIQKCSDIYDTSAQNVKDSRAYYNCVWEAPCLKHHNGYNTRLQLLSDIDDILESQHEDRGDWWNGARRTDSQFLIWVISILTLLKILHGAIN